MLGWLLLACGPTPDGVELGAPPASNDPRWQCASRAPTGPVTVEGVVQAGGPVHGAPIYRWDATSGRWRAVAWTDADGAFRFETEGPAFLSAAPSGGDHGKGSACTADLAPCAEGAESRCATFALFPARVSPLRLSVVDAAGEPVADAEVLLQDEGGRHRRLGSAWLQTGVFTDERGEAELSWVHRMVRGSISARHDTLTRVALDRTAAATCRMGPCVELRDGTPVEARVRLGPPAVTLRGRVLGAATGRRVPGARVVDYASGLAAPTDADGSYVLPLPRPWFRTIATAEGYADDDEITASEWLGFDDTVDFVLQPLRPIDVVCEGIGEAECRGLWAQGTRAGDRFAALVAGAWRSWWSPRTTWCPLDAPCDVRVAGAVARISAADHRVRLDFRPLPATLEVRLPAEESCTAVVVKDVRGGDPHVWRDGCGSGSDNVARFAGLPAQPVRVRVRRHPEDDVVRDVALSASAPNLVRIP
ncbi:MAG: carboxypeptidase-like regulatory domain-containing protein [Myxococcota bacterium]